MAAEEFTYASKTCCDAPGDVFEPPAPMIVVSLVLLIVWCTQAYFTWPEHLRESTRPDPPICGAASVADTP